MKRESAQSEGLRPVEDNPDVRTAWQAVLAARAAVREADARLLAARQAAEMGFQETHTVGPMRAWSPAAFWRARRDLGKLEEAYAEAQGHLEEVTATHAQAVARAKADLTPKVQAQLLTHFRAALTALETVRPVLAAWADGVDGVGAWRRRAGAGLAAHHPGDGHGDARGDNRGMGEGAAAGASTPEGAGARQVPVKPFVNVTEGGIIAPSGMLPGGRGKNAAARGAGVGARRGAPGQE